MANNILNYKGNLIGKSLKEENCESVIDDILKQQQKKFLFNQLSRRCCGGKKYYDKAVIKELSEVSNDDLILDIGPNNKKN